MNSRNIILILAILTTGLLAGLYYSYQWSVNPGLGAMADAKYVAAMQSINNAIQNPVFFLAFIGPVILLPLSAYQHRKISAAACKWLVASAVLFIGGSLGVTMFGNVPLNNALAAFDINTATAEQIHAARVQFERPWNTWHLVRTLATIASFACTLITKNVSR